MFKVKQVTMSKWLSPRNPLEFPWRSVACRWISNNSCWWIHFRLCSILEYLKSIYQLYNINYIQQFDYIFFILLKYKDFRVCAALFDHTVRGALFPLHASRALGPATQGQSGTCPRPRFEGCAGQPSGQEAPSANFFRKECQGCNEAWKPSCPAPQFNNPRQLSPPSTGDYVRCKTKKSGSCKYKDYTYPLHYPHLKPL